MEKHRYLNDDEFELQFKNSTLPVEFFTHEAHLRLAWIHIRQYGIDQAIQNIHEQLMNYVTAQGARDKFNLTLTIAAIRVVHHFMLQSEQSSFQLFMSKNTGLKTHFKELIGFHYQTDIFNSELAKKVYIEPELLPFD